MSDAIQTFIDSVSQQVALDRQISEERSAGRDTMSSGDLTNALLNVVSEGIASGFIPGDYSENVKKLRQREEKVQLFARQAERCELS